MLSSSPPSHLPSPVPEACDSDGACRLAVEMRSVVRGDPRAAESYGAAWGGARWDVVIAARRDMRVGRVVIVVVAGATCGGAARGGAQIDCRGGRACVRMRRGVVRGAIVRVRGEPYGGKRMVLRGEAHSEKRWCRLRALEAPVIPGRVVRRQSHGEAHARTQSVRLGALRERGLVASSYSHRGVEDWWLVSVGGWIGLSRVRRVPLPVSAARGHWSGRVYALVEWDGAGAETGVGRGDDVRGVSEYQPIARRRGAPDECRRARDVRGRARDGRELYAGGDAQGLRLDLVKS
ncbi:hypothetical protein C8R44DRAFT_732047 [Mycena epipterygia]|nr:hypothetical protein C8R44DRAFT_732047 [Mycena epipterygia]